MKAKYCKGNFNLLYTGIPHFNVLCFIALTDIVSLQIKGKTLHQQKDYDLLYDDTCFIVVVWK